MAIKSSFDFKNTGIGEMLRQGRLAVPPNQRSYAWIADRHVERLLKDLWSTISGATPSDYFLGTIVLIQSEKNDDRLIVDGQQRLATVSIILARIRDHFTSLKREGSARSVEEAFIGHTDPDTEEIAPRLRLNDDDNDFFWNTVLKPAPVDKPLKPKPGRLRASNRKLLNASERARLYIGELINPLPTGDDRVAMLLRWYKYLDTKAHVLAVTVADEVSAFRLFETLNDRGLRASQADILKNFFFSKSGPRLDEAKTMWTRMSASIEALVDERDDDDDASDDEESPARANPLLTYIRHSWITLHGHTKTKELAASIRDEITSETRAMAHLVELSSAVGDYAALSNAKHHKWSSYPSTTRQNIEIISDHLRVTQIKPLLFAVAKQFDPTETDKALRLFVSWSVRFLIFGGRGGLLDTQYARLAFEVGTKRYTKARELREAMKSVVPSDGEFEQAFATARVSKNYLARYYLRAMGKSYNNLPHPEYVENQEVRDITLEHVMPLESKKHWKVDPDTAESAKRYLGNMVLLREPTNRDLANKSWPDKKVEYGRSGYELTKMVAEYPDDPEWSIDQIRDRQARLAKIALNTWTLSFEE